MNNNTNSKNINKILKELFDKPTYRFHIRELARLTRLNPNTILNIAKILEKQGIVKREAKKHFVEVYLNIESKEVIWKKRLFNLSQLYSSGIADFLIREYSPKSISIIGSYSRGEDLEKSDIDIAVRTNKKEIIDLEKFERILNRKIHLLILPEKVSNEFFNNLINGILLYGYIRK